MMAPSTDDRGHRRTVYGPTIESIQRELLPALTEAHPHLRADREALARSAVGRLLMQLGDYEAGVVQLERAVDALPERSVPRAATLLWLAWPYGSPRPVAWHLDQVRRAVAAVPTDASRAERLMLDRLRVTRLLTLGDEQGWAHLDLIPDDATDQETALQAVLGHADIAYAALLWGRYHRADEHIAVTQRLSGRWYFEGFTDALESTRVHLDWYVGRWEGLAERALALTTTGHDRFARLQSLLVAGELSVACGLPERAGTNPEVVLRDIRPHEAPELLAQAAAHAARRRMRLGDAERAAEVTERATDEVLASGSWLSAVEIVPTRLDALAAARRRAEAEELIKRFEDLLGGRSDGLARAALAEARAVLAEGDAPEEAADRLAEAREALAGLPRPYDAALCRLRRAETLLVLGRRDDAVAELRVGRQELAALKAWPHVADVEGRLGRLGVRGTSSRAGRRAYGDALSPRERDVVTLVAAGLTDRQIGDELVLSARTVAHHVASARRKLQAPSRTALAVAAIAAGVIAHPADRSH